MIVVPVFITSCHVSLNENSGPVIAHTKITSAAITKVTGFPVTSDESFAKRVKKDVLCIDISLSYQTLAGKFFDDLQHRLHVRLHKDIIFDERNTFADG